MYHPGATTPTGGNWEQGPKVVPGVSHLLVEASVEQVDTSQQSRDSKTDEVGAPATGEGPNMPVRFRPSALGFDADAASLSESPDGLNPMQREGLTRRLARFEAVLRRDEREGRDSVDVTAAREALL